MEILLSALTWMDFKGIMLREVSQREKDILWPLTHEILN